jgi:hypothetical protein
MKSVPIAIFNLVGLLRERLPQEAIVLLDFEMDVPDEEYGGYIDVAMKEKQYTVACLSGPEGNSAGYRVSPVIGCVPLQEWELSFEKDAEVVERVADLLL